MIPSTSLQDAVALLTVAMDVTAADELRDLVAEFRRKDESDDLMLAVVALCRSLCMATSTLVHVIDDQLSQSELDDLTEEDLLPIAMDVVRSYANSAARSADRPSDVPSPGPGAR